MLIVLSSVGKAIARFHSGHLNESGPAPGGRELIGQTENLTFDQPDIRPSPFTL